MQDDRLMPEQRLVTKYGLAFVNDTDDFILSRL